MMKRFVEGVARDQGVLFPGHLNDFIGEDNPVRTLDALVDMLDDGSRCTLTFRHHRVAGYVTVAKSQWRYHRCRRRLAFLLQHDRREPRYTACICSETMNLEHRTSPLTKSWLPAVKGLVAMCIVAPFAALMLIGGLQNGEIALIVIGGLLSLGVLIGVPSVIWDLFTSPRGGYGQCPICSNSIEAQSGDHQNLLCAGCGTYLDAKIDRLETIEPGRTTDKPFFATPTPWPEVRGVVSSTVAFSAFDYAQDKLTELMMKKAGVKLLNATWPAGCCVCGRPATRLDQYGLPVTLAGQIRDTKATLIANNVPYCAEHKHGIAFDRVSFNSGITESSYGILFRSHAYRESFRKLNNWTWAGLVPKPPGNLPASPASGDKVVVRCSNCSQQLRVPFGKGGTMKCPSCGQAFKAAT